MTRRIVLAIVQRLMAVPVIQPTLASDKPLTVNDYTLMGGSAYVTVDGKRYRITVTEE